MKNVGLKCFLFTLLFSSIFLASVILIDEYFFTSYEISSFVVGYFTCFVSIVIRTWFLKKFAPNEGEGFTKLKA